MRSHLLSRPPCHRADMLNQDFFVDLKTLVMSWQVKTPGAQQFHDNLKNRPHHGNEHAPQRGNRLTTPME